MADRYVEAAPNGAGHRSVTEIVQDIANHIQEIVRSEIQLAKAELGERGRRVARSAALLGGGLALLALAGTLAIVAVVAALALVMPVWLACLLMAVFLLMAGGGMAIVGRQRLAQSSLKPEQTIESVREDVRWLKHQTR